MKVVLYTHDPMLTLARTPEETKELFGEDYLEEEGVEVPAGLVNEAVETYKKLVEISRELAKYRK